MGPLFRKNAEPMRGLSFFPAALTLRKREAVAGYLFFCSGQMLNLDLLGAIAFDKGCYTGQEVIARAHYRGRVKRRMQRWLNTGDTELKPGDAVRSQDGRPLAVVRVARDEQGRQELLAIGTFGPDAAGATEADAAGGIVVEGPLPLPYSLPD